jgi:hypothetical protein
MWFTRLLRFNLDDYAAKMGKAASSLSIPSPSFKCIFVCCSVPRLTHRSSARHAARRQETAFKGIYRDSQAQHGHYIPARSVAGPQNRRVIATRESACQEAARKFYRMQNASADPGEEAGITIQLLYAFFE